MKSLAWAIIIAGYTIGAGVHYGLRKTDWPDGCHLMFFIFMCCFLICMAFEK